MPFWAGMLILFGCSAFVLVALGAVAWSVNESIRRERERERRRAAVVAERWSVGAVIRWQDSELRRLTANLKRRGRG